LNQAVSFNMSSLLVVLQLLLLKQVVLKIQSSNLCGTQKKEMVTHLRIILLVISNLLVKEPWALTKIKANMPS
jgi:hypothetical protein